MTPTSSKKRWSAEQRLEFIDFLAYWEGSINRSHIIAHFGVSAQQASADLGSYQMAAPGNLTYDLRSKRYVATEHFSCVFVNPDADRYLAQIGALTSHAVEKEDTWLNEPPVADLLPVPTRRVNAAILRSISTAIRAQRSIEILYQSLNTATPAPIWRRITPHAFATDGTRWHTRAFCHRDQTFKDFLLSRCRDTRDQKPATVNVEDDTAWNTYFEVVLSPNPRLSKSEQQVIQLDYGMYNGRVILPVRQAMLYYFDKRFKGEFAPDGSYSGTSDPKRTPVIVENQEAYEAIINLLVK
jgi:predicted DNA-binding transcriptional regulator YafY